MASKRANTVIVIAHIISAIVWYFTGTPALLAFVFLISMAYLFIIGIIRKDAIMEEDESINDPMLTWMEDNEDVLKGMSPKEIAETWKVIKDETN